MTPEIEHFIKENAKINVPNNYVKKYMQLLKKHNSLFIVTKRILADRM